MRIHRQKFLALLVFIVPVVLFALTITVQQIRRASARTEEARQKVVRKKISAAAVAARSFAIDHKGRLPPTKNWEQALKPYLPSDFTFDLPMPEGTRPRRIALNRYVAKEKWSDIAPANAILFYESMTTHANACDIRANLPTPDDGSEGYIMAHTDGGCPLHPFGYREELFRLESDTEASTKQLFDKSPVSRQQPLSPTEY